MKAWAEKRRRELEASGEAELAHMFELVVQNRGQVLYFDTQEARPDPKTLCIASSS